MHLTSQPGSVERLKQEHRELRKMLDETEAGLVMLKPNRWWSARYLRESLRRLGYIVEAHFVPHLEREKRVLHHYTGALRWDLPSISAQASELRAMSLLTEAGRLAMEAEQDADKVSSGIQLGRALVAFLRWQMDAEELYLFPLAERVSSFRRHCGGAAEPALAAAV